MSLLVACGNIEQCGVIHKQMSQYFLMKKSKRLTDCSVAVVKNITNNFLNLRLS